VSSLRPRVLSFDEDIDGLAAGTSRPLTRSFGGGSEALQGLVGRGLAAFPVVMCIVVAIMAIMTIAAVRRVLSWRVATVLSIIVVVTVLTIPGWQMSRAIIPHARKPILWLGFIPWSSSSSSGAHNQRSQQDQQAISSSAALHNSAHDNQPPVFLYLLINAIIHIWPLSIRAK
jgi:glucan phosphoethanolaminetransferase (alkaline phosphatase superfamily)